MVSSFGGLFAIPISIYNHMNVNMYFNPLYKCLKKRKVYDTSPYSTLLLYWSILKAALTSFSFLSAKHLQGSFDAANEKSLSKNSKTYISERRQGATDYCLAAGHIRIHASTPDMTFTQYNNR